MSDRRFPRWVYDHGTEPDARFTLANERTFLAWVRTAVAVLAGGVALEAFNVPLDPGFRGAAVIVLLVLGLVLPLTAWFGWAQTERAMREGAHLPGSVPALLLAVAIPAVAGLLLVGTVLR